MLSIVSPPLTIWLQQCLPLTVLKLSITHFITPYYLVATVLTAYGIETQYLLHE